jgi:CRP/FNR family transcriptional regulator
MTTAQCPRCHECLVRDSSLCASLSDSELTKLSTISRRKAVPAGAVISWEGDDNALCANVVKGALKLLKTTADGREQTVGLLSDGDFVGQPFADLGTLTAIALTNTELCLYPRASFERVMSEQPKLERALLERTMRSLNEARDRQLTLARKSAKAKLAGFLLDLLRNRPGGTVDLPMSRGDIGDYLGLTIETVSRQFTELKSAGIIAADRGGRTVSVNDVAALQALADD